MFNDIILQERHHVLVALLAKNNPDVICLQEVLSKLTGWFILSLEPKGYIPVCSTLVPSHRTYGELIFVRKEMVVLKYAHVPLPSIMGRQLFHAQIYFNSVVYNIVTFHLESMNNAKRRGEQLGILWERFGNLPNAIFCGDSNLKEGEEDRAPKNVYDVYSHTEGDIGKYTYWGYRYWDNEMKERYDRMWCSKNISVRSFGVLGNDPIESLQDKWISDHDGLIVTLDTSVQSVNPND